MDGDLESGLLRGAGLVTESRQVASNGSPEIGNRDGVFREQSARTVVSTTIPEVATADPDDIRYVLLTGIGKYGDG